MSTLKTIGGPLVEIKSVCFDCGHRHTDRCLPWQMTARLDEWRQRHAGHRIEFSSPRRIIPRDLDDSQAEENGHAPWWLDFHGFKENANIKLATYPASVAMTYTSLNSLASDTNLLAGASSLAVDNTSNLYLDYEVGGFITNIHTPAPTAGKEIDVWLYRAYDDTPTYPDTLLGTDAAKTITTVNMMNTGLKLVSSMTIAATVDQKNWFDGGSVSSYFGGFLPHLFALFVVHNSGQALNSAGGTCTTKGLYATSI